ncbi:MAG: response regulator, partial [Desulfopila sp.]|nr:response regulator [Desulfopila sp.]
MKVLVIDEKNDIAESLLGEAQQLEVEVHSAATLDEGVLICEQRGADIVMMRDIISGCASCSLIQDFKNTSAVPEIIIYAEHGSPEHAEQALEGGAWDYFVDPAPGQKLPDMLRRVVRFRRNKSG